MGFCLKPRPGFVVCGTFYIDDQAGPYSCMNSGVAVIVKAVKVANKVNKRTWDREFGGVTGTIAPRPIISFSFGGRAETCFVF